MKVFFIVASKDDVKRLQNELNKDSDNIVGIHKFQGSDGLGISSEDEPSPLRLKHIDDIFQQ